MKNNYMNKTLIKQITGLTDDIEENVGKKRKHLIAGIYSVKFRVCIVILILLITTSLTLTAFLQVARWGRTHEVKFQSPILLKLQTPVWVETIKESTISAKLNTTVATTTPSPSLIKDVYGSEK